MKQIASLRHLKKLEGKTIFLRSDFNVPIKNKKIEDDFKIIAALPTIRFFMRHKCKIIIATHLGDPKINLKSKKEIKKLKDLTTLPIAKRLSTLLDVKVKHLNDCVGSLVYQAIQKLKNGEIVLLENLRFYVEEEKNDSEFARALAHLADIYVNNAFAVSHRDHASVSAIKKYLPSYAGLLLEREVLSLEKILKPKKPLTVLMGGAKISTKLPLLEKLSREADFVLLGGGLANTMLYAMGYEIGRSLCEKDDYFLLRHLRYFYKKFGNKKILLPLDVITAKINRNKIKASIKSINQINKNDYIYDIGPKTINFYTKFIKKANTIVWNGPLGMFEKPCFKHGTIALGQMVAARSTGKAFGVVGGGETIEALKMTKMIDFIDWVSTGGGAMLSYLSGEKMPGLKGIIK